MLNQTPFAEGIQRLSEQANSLALHLETVSAKATAAAAAVAHSGPSEFWWLLTVFVLACFVGFYVVWSVTPALHSPLMGVTNAISSVIIVGALLAAGPDIVGGSKTLGVIAVFLASINIFGGFIVTQRMLAMFKKKQK
ncbi:NAD(P) transhydrogenase subunit alpha [Pararhodospirillum photometricum]|uniref:proton-translocating NAD(P)(+) transhydrogenase n=1 Tax=Pararhodospirillum photometricum DSM 122 TaxID=1150469 RepID=H6SS38_PARPM|nr:NAD(P) transhydrogenase subunit alpha [Pararhodospirillum photometricum]CCG07717.1 NAD(P) transhydrogenase subunit alpha part 2 [Pararhodospirillum photometricum DSM 122]